MTLKKLILYIYLSPLNMFHLEEKFVIFCGGMAPAVQSFSMCNANGENSSCIYVTIIISQTASKVYIVTLSES